MIDPQTLPSQTRASNGHRPQHRLGTDPKQYGRRYGFWPPFVPIRGQELAPRSSTE